MLMLPNPCHSAGVSQTEIIYLKNIVQDEHNTNKGSAPGSVQRTHTASLLCLKTVMLPPKTVEISAVALAASLCSSLLTFYFS